MKSITVTAREVVFYEVTLEVADDFDISINSVNLHEIVAEVYDSQSNEADSESFEVVNVEVEREGDA